MKRLSITIISVFSLFACVDSGNTLAQLERAQTLMSEYSDSAKFVLETIDRTTIKSRRGKARFALLYSQALDKNYIDVTSDSLIRPAVDYYQNHGSVTEKFLTNYYLGRVFHNAGEYVQAMLAYTDAKTYLDELDDNYYAGLLYAQIGIIHSKHYDNPSCLEARQKSYDYYAKTNLTSHQNYALLDLALAYRNLQEYDKSEAIIREVIDIALAQADSSLLEESQMHFAMQLADCNNHQEAKQFFLEAEHTHRSISSAALERLAYIYACENKIDSANMCIAKAFRVATNKVDSANVCFSISKISKIQKDYRKALDNLEISIQTQDSIFRKILHQSVVVAQRDFFQDRSDFAFYKLKTRTQMLAMAIVFLILLAIVLTLYLRRQLQLKNLEIAKYMNMASDIEQTLQLRDIEMSELVQQLFKDKFELIDRLGSTYYERQNTPAEQEAIYHEVKQAIRDLGVNKHTKAELERIVNACKQNIIQRFRDQFPQAKETDIDLLSYLSAGFSYRAISIFTQDRIENIYNRKSRLKSRITDSDAVDKDLFIAMLS